MVFCQKGWPEELEIWYQVQNTLLWWHHFGCCCRLILQEELVNVELVLAVDAAHCYCPFDDSLGNIAADQVCYVSVLHWSQIPYTVFLSTELCWGRLLEKVFHALETGDISKLPPWIDWIFSGKHLIHFLVLKTKDFQSFVLHNCFLVFDDEQVYLKLQVINLKNKEVTVKQKPQNLPTNWFFENPTP